MYHTKYHAYADCLLYSILEVILVLLVKHFYCIQENQTALDDTQISVKSTGIGIPGDQFCFVNLKSGLKRHELLVCYLKVCINIQLCIYLVCLVLFAYMCV